MIIWDSSKKAWFDLTILKVKVFLDQDLAGAILDLGRGEQRLSAALFAHIRVSNLMELPFDLVGSAIEPLVTR